MSNVNVKHVFKRVRCFLSPGPRGNGRSRLASNGKFRPSTQHLLIRNRTELHPRAEILDNNWAPLRLQTAAESPSNQPPQKQKPERSIRLTDSAEVGYKSNSVGPGKATLDGRNIKHPLYHLIIMGPEFLMFVPSFRGLRLNMETARKPSWAILPLGLDLSTATKT